MAIKTLSDIVSVRYNIKMNCSQFYEFLKNETKLLKEITSECKYAFKRMKENDDDEDEGEW